MFISTPYYLRNGKAIQTSNFIRTFIGSIRTKAHWNFGNSCRGRSQELPKIFRAPMYTAHRVVLLAIARHLVYKCYALSIAYSVQDSIAFNSTPVALILESMCCITLSLFHILHGQGRCPWNFHEISTKWQLLQFNCQSKKLYRPILHLHIYYSV